MTLMDHCQMVLLVQAELDGELDAAQAANLQEHRAGCRICQAAEAELARTRNVLRQDLYQPAPEALRQRVLAALDAADPRRTSGLSLPEILSRFRSWRQSTTGFGLGAACTAALAFLVLSPPQQNFSDQVVASHLRALQPGHLEDVVSTDQHTVKPWFDGRIDFAPPVKDFGAMGFPLKGGRLDYIGGRPVAALVYQRGKHIINLFVWPAMDGVLSAPAFNERNGYNIVHWLQNGTQFWAVSDLERSQLDDFVADWQRSP
jgi:anti-sigma factor RsiW